MSIQRKRGQLSTEEETYIRENIKVLSVDKIATNLNRTTTPILRYMREQNLISAEMSDQETIQTNLRAQLHSREYWNEIQKQFTDDELRSFEEDWVKLMLQFREDVLYAEELELKQYLTLEILINRNLAERKRATQDAERLQKMLDKEYVKDDDVRDIALITSLESQLSFARTAIPAFATEYTKLLEKRQAVSKDLKATRDQRIKRIEDSKSSWAGFIRALENEEERERLGNEIELMRLAKEKAKERLSGLHTYVDGKIDRCLLNNESVILDDIKIGDDND